MLLSLPTPALPSMDLRVTFDDVVFTLRVQWNMRSGWYVGLTALDGTVVFAPRFAAEGVNLLAQITSALRPRGVLFLSDRSGLHREAGFTSLGTTHVLAFYSETDLA